jgi:hypothetical protein
MRAQLSLIALLVAASLCGVVLAQPHPLAPPTATVTDGTARRAPSHAIFPTQRLPLRFDHGRHLRIAGVTCVRCHTTAATSGEASDRLIPPESTCTPCHAIERAHPSARCAMCHEGWSATTPQRVARIDVPTPNLHFSHRAHVSRGQSCASCHGDLRNTALATRLDLPVMESCLRCHQQRGTASGRCATCHLTEPDGVLRTRFAEGWLNPPTFMRGMHHDADFWYTHRVSAAQDPTRCAACHRDDECAACHDGRIRDRRTHPNDYLTQHPVEARMRANTCGSCHRQATFCVACHERAGVAMSASPSARVQARFHPAAEVWSGRTVTSRHHGIEARRSLSTCVSCHAERDCVTCHATAVMGGGGFSPHPPGFLARCGVLLRANARPCGQCHDDLDAIAARCQ